MDSIYKILESLDKVSENKESGVKITNIQWKDPGAKLPSSLKLNITAPSGSSNEQIYARIHNELKDEYGEVDDFDFQFEESLEEGQYDGKSREELMKMKAKAEADIKNMQSSGSGAQQKFYDETQMMMAQQHLDSINNALKKVSEADEYSTTGLLKAILKNPFDSDAGFDYNKKHGRDPVGRKIKPTGQTAQSKTNPPDPGLGLKPKGFGEAMEDEDGASVEDIASAITRRMMNAKNFGALVREIDILDLNDAIEEVARFHEGGDLGTSDVSNMVRDVLKQLGKQDMKLEDVEVKEEDVEEGNEFTEKRLKAIEAGKNSFSVNGKTYKVTGDTSDEEKMTEDYDKDEYDEEGEMADNQLDVVHDAAQELQDIIDSDDNLPEWVQSKITKAMDYLDTARDYMKSVEDDEESADDVEPPKDEGDEEVEETTTAGAVATTAGGEGIYKNASVYEGYNSRVDNMITEGMNVTVTASDEGEPSVSVNATGEDAMALSQLLQLAAVPQQQQMTKKVCKNCGDEQGKPEHMDCPYDCMDPMGENFMEVACEADEANSADNGVTYDMHYLINSISGGLNGPKRQINPNNPGDNPMAMTGIGKDTLNMSQQVSEGEDVKSHLETLYKEFKSK